MTARLRTLVDRIMRRFGYYPVSKWYGELPRVTLLLHNPGNVPALVDLTVVSPDEDSQ